jgi:glycine betaine/proline transport system ATP-binding protein
VPEIRIARLTKIFGPRPARALALLGDGVDPAAIRARIRHTVALHDVDLAIAPGETFVVMGLSGSGKSTLVRTINRLIEPTRGSVTIGGVDWATLSPRALRAARREGVAMVFQRFGLFPHRTVWENVAFGLRVRGLSTAAQRAGANAWLERVGLSGFERALPHELSGGMQQRVGLARALATDAPVLLLDEPFGALDPLIRRELQDELARLQRELGKTIVFITHDLAEALRLGDRIAILAGGRVVQVGTPAEIVLSPSDDYVAAFVQDVDRARSLRVRDAMTPSLGALRASEAATIALDAPLMAALAAFAQGADALAVIDDDGARVGTLDARGALAVATGVSRPR